MAYDINRAFDLVPASPGCRRGPSSGTSHPPQVPAQHDRRGPAAFSRRPRHVQDRPSARRSGCPQRHQDGLAPACRHQSRGQQQFGRPTLPENVPPAVHRQHDPGLAEGHSASGCGRPSPSHGHVRTPPAGAPPGRSRQSPGQAATQPRPASFPRKKAAPPRKERKGARTRRSPVAGTRSFPGSQLPGSQLRPPTPAPPTRAPSGGPARQSPTTDATSDPNGRKPMQERLGNEPPSRGRGRGSGRRQGSPTCATWRRTTNGQEFRGLPPAALLDSAHLWLRALEELKLNFNEAATFTCSLKDGTVRVAVISSASLFGHCLSRTVRRTSLVQRHLAHESAIRVVAQVDDLASATKRGPVALWVDLRIATLTLFCFRCMPHLLTLFCFMPHLFKKAEQLWPSTNLNFDGPRFALPPSRPPQRRPTRRGPAIHVRRTADASALRHPPRVRQGAMEQQSHARTNCPTRRSLGRLKTPRGGMQAPFQGSRASQALGRKSLCPDHRALRDGHQLASTKEMGECFRPTGKAICEVTWGASQARLRVGNNRATGEKLMAPST